MERFEQLLFAILIVLLEKVGREDSDLLGGPEEDFVALYDRELEQCFDMLGLLERNILATVQFDYIFRVKLASYNHLVVHSVEQIAQDKNVVPVAEIKLRCETNPID